MIKDKPISELLEFSIINIDKPTGPTSFSVSQFIKNSLGLKKTSHLGTLDPIVTGVLPVALNRACRLSDYLMRKDKEYVGIMRLHDDIDEKRLIREMQKFTGTIEQLPPVRSSVKRAPRLREIKRFCLVEKHGKDVLFIADVEAGTYIRKLIHDLGEKIGGAHMLELRRTRAGIFDESQSLSLYDFERAVSDFKEGREETLRKMLVPASDILKKSMKNIAIKEKNIRQILTGKPLTKEDFADLNETDRIKEGEAFAVFLKNRFIEIARKAEEEHIVAKPEFVLN